MTIPASMPSRVVYQGDGVTVNFPIPFVYFGNGDGTKQLKAVLADATGENEQVLTENIDFTITAAGQVNGTMTMKTAPTAKQKLTVIYDIPIEQLVDWKEFGRLPDITCGATHYINPKACKKLPKWAVGKKPCIIIGAHHFYNNID